MSQRRLGNPTGRRIGWRNGKFRPQRGDSSTFNFQVSAAKKVNMSVRGPGV